MLQPLFGGLGQAVALAGSQSTDLFSVIELCTASGIRFVRAEDLDPSGGAGGEDAPDPSSAFCPGCLTATSFALCNAETADLVRYDPEPARPVQAGTSDLPCQLFTCDINARAPPRLA